MHFINDLNYSYWEKKQYFRTFDLIIIGSGIVGLNTAISFRQMNLKAKILILERGFLPDGASSKNAGFACFGSAGELLDDLKTIPEKTVWETVKMRWEGLKLLRHRLKDKNIDFRSYGGFELFDDRQNYNSCLENLDALNRQMHDTIGVRNCYRTAAVKKYGFHKVNGAILNEHEGQIDTAMMIHNLLLMARKLGVDILNNVLVNTIIEANSQVELITSLGTFKAQKVVVATNGFARTLLNLEAVKPARAQVLITKPIPGLKIKGTFHFLKGYFYFRNIDDRVLFGGGRNMDFETETTERQGLNPKIQSGLDALLREMILPNTAFEVDQRWSGIMGIGDEKKPIIRPAGKNVLAAVRMGGMGIAIGSLVGEKAAREIS